MSDGVKHWVPIVSGVADGALSHPTRKCVQCEKPTMMTLCADCLTKNRIFDDIAWLTGTGRYGQ